MNALTTSPSKSLFGLNRPNQILIGLVVIQLLIATVVFWPQGSTVGSRLTIEGFSLDTVTQLTITDNEGDQMTFKKGEVGWVWPDADDYPLVEATVTDLLEKIVALDTNRLVTRTDSSHKRLEVAEDAFARQVIIGNKDGDSQTIFVGSSPSGGSTHVRLAGQDETYLTGDLNAWQISPQISNWIETEYLNIPSSDITSLRLQNAQGDFTFEKNETGEWMLTDLAEDEELAPNSVASLASGISVIRMIEPIGKTAQADFGLNSPQATITITANNETDGEQTYIIQVGAANEENEYIIKGSHSDYFVRVAQFAVSSLIEQGRSEFLTEPAASETDIEGDTTASE